MKFLSLLCFMSSEVDDKLNQVETLRREESCYFVNELINVVSQSEMRAEFVSLAEHVSISH